MILDNALFILIVGGVGISALDLFCRLRSQAQARFAVVNRELAGAQA